MKLNDNGGENGLVFALLVCAVAAIGIVALTWFALGSARAADNQPPATACLTKEQARAKWPRDYLYWHGVNHCWDNVRAYAKPDRARKGPRIDKLPLDANGNEIRVKKVRWQEYNELDAAADRETFFEPTPIPRPRFTPWEERIQ